MISVVPGDQIERIVGARRHANQHLGRARTAERLLYVLHSQECLDSEVDIRECQWSLALSKGIDLDRWVGHKDAARALAIYQDRLVPLAPTWTADRLLEVEQ